MNIVTNSKSYFTLLILVCSLFLAPSCHGQQRYQHADQSLILDTLRVDIDSKGYNALIKIMETGGERNRNVKIELRNGTQVSRVLQNNQLIPCSTCGRQSSDPYTAVTLSSLTTNAFEISLDSRSYIFSIDHASRNVFLRKIDVLHVTEGKDRYLEWHEIYTPEDFGKLPITQIREGHILKLRDSATLKKLKDFYAR